MPARPTYQQLQISQPISTRVPESRSQGQREKDKTIILILIILIASHLGRGAVPPLAYAIWAIDGLAMQMIGHLTAHDAVVLNGSLEVIMYGMIHDQAILIRITHYHLIRPVNNYILSCTACHC